ncbi:MAG: D-alanyl-D-alanine carboxypeptidase family protein [Myxococcales bacterium]|nr:D-alanyl-D-alanine carboxypeptidase family protein [Myxococcota bacterium]MDW8283014.1 D-alanyl-D-alanine carboxypeptidase family protein [Myxococcales bacterium]
MVAPGALMLLTLACSGLPLHGGTLRAAGPSWVTSVALAAQLQAERGLAPRAEMGFVKYRPHPVAVVDLSPDGSVQAEVRTALAFFRMADAARRAGVNLVVVSGFRSHQKQAELYRLYRRGRGPLASRPGASNHQSGRALDLDMSLPGVKEWLRRHARRYGFRRTVPSERWHWEHVD